jgi:hypothetical protein
MATNMATENIENPRKTPKSGNVATVRGPARVGQPNKIGGRTNMRNLLALLRPALPGESTLCQQAAERGIS